MKARKFLALTLVVAALLLLCALNFSSAQAPVNLDGQLLIVWGDSDPAIRYYLFDESGQATQLLLDEALTRPQGGILAINGQQITVTGAWAATPGAALHVEAISLAGDAGSGQPDDVVGSQPWVSILCKFADIPDEPEPLSYFESLYSTTYPGLDHFWREVSYDLIDLIGSDSVGWYVLPQPRSYYVYDQDGDGIPDLNFGRAAQDCTAVADPDVYFPDFVGVNLMFNATLDCCAWGGSWYLNLDGVSKLYRMTWEPPWGYQNQAVLAHEMGHGFGFPHSCYNPNATYDNRWDVMSSIWNNSPVHPVYGVLGQHTISFHMDLAGWIADEAQITVPAGSRARVTLEQVALPHTDNYLLARVPILGSGYHFYTVEARRQTGYDNVLPGQAVIIHEVDLGRDIPAHVVGTDGSSGAMWLPGEQYVDLAAGITIRVEEATASGYVVTIWNQVVSLSELDLSGPAGGLPDISYPFTVTVEPVNATLPITYVWQATGYAPLTRTKTLSDVVYFSWPVTGPQTVTVTASNAGLIQLSASQPITIYDPAQADFGGGPVTGIAPLTVTLSNLSSGGYETCQWAWGDGQTSAGCDDPSHVYIATGVFSVSLAVSGFGSGDTLTRSRYVTIYQPVAADLAAWPLSGTVPLAVSFSNLSSGDYVTCTWLFGDGGSSNACEHPTHTFAATGTYTVSLTVGGPGGVDTALKPHWITVRERYRRYLPLVLRQP